MFLVLDLHKARKGERRAGARYVSRRWDEGAHEWRYTYAAKHQTRQRGAPRVNAAGRRRAMPANLAAPLAHLFSQKPPDPDMIDELVVEADDAAIDMMSDRPYMYAPLKGRPALSRLTTTGADVREHGGVVFSKKPLSLGDMARHGLQPADATAGIPAMIAYHRAKYGADLPMVWTVPGKPHRGALLAPSTAVDGKLQITFYDQKGFTGHLTVNDVHDGARHAAMLGMTAPDLEGFEATITSDGFRSWFND